MEEPRTRRLTIGEFAAATQLTAKALRLYDEQGLLKPEAVDAATGYRYYRTAQVQTGRLVRALREMNVSLLQIRQVLDTAPGLQPALLRDLLREAEQRLAKERSAYQSAVLMLRSQTPSAAARIDEIETFGHWATITPFSTTRHGFVQDALQHLAASVASLRAHGLEVDDGCSLVLQEPLADDDAHVELIVTVASSEPPPGLTTHHLPARRYASIEAPQTAWTDGFAACTDALFDWFDRKGVQAEGPPEIRLDNTHEDLRWSVRWAFASAQSERGLRDD